MKNIKLIGVLALTLSFAGSSMYAFADSTTPVTTDPASGTSSVGAATPIFQLPSSTDRTCLLFGIANPVTIP